MALVSEETIKKIKTSNNIVDIIGKYLTLTPKGKNYFGVCPFHDDHSPSMSVSPDKQIYTCFSCGATGNVVTFIMDYEKVSFVEALKILGENVGIRIDDAKTKKVDETSKKYYELYNTTTMYYKNNLNSKEGKKAREYLYNRKISDEIIKEFDIGLALNSSLYKSLLGKYSSSDLIEMDICKESNGLLYDTFKDRIMFPIKDEEGNFVAFSGRIYNNEDLNKYVNTKETKIFKKGKILYNLYNAKEYIRKEKEIIICEGQMDVIRISSIGIKNVVGLMGTSFTKEQFEIIKKLKSQVILNLDQDDAGRSAAISIGNILTGYDIDVSVVVFKEYKDSDDFISNNGKEAFKKALKNKVSFIDFKLNYLKSQKNLKDSVELSKYINEAIENINKINDDILRELKISELSKEFDVNEEILRSKLLKKSKVVYEKKEPANKRKKILNKYQISEIRIIYLMLEHEEIIRIYEKTLGYLISERMTNLANEIINFRQKNKGFDYSDFITYIIQDEELNTTYKEVLNYNHIKEYTESELDDYITIIKEYSVECEINKLKNKMKDELDVEEKKKIAKKIENIKKEVLKW